jgi:hypothetical protein
VAELLMKKRRGLIAFCKYPSQFVPIDSSHSKTISKADDVYSLKGDSLGICVRVGRG